MPLGTILERIRRVHGYTLEVVAHAVWISVQALEHYETGLRTPPEAIVDDLAEFYGIDPKRLTGDQTAERVSATSPDERDRLWIGWMSVELAPADDNDVLLTKIANAFRVMRQIGEHEAVTVRDAELTAIGEVLDLSDVELEARLQRRFALERAEAADLAARMRSSQSD